jgi:hypothetical protein
VAGEGTLSTGAEPIWAADNLEVSVAGGTCNAVGDNLLVTPPAGQRLVVRYLMYNPELDNTVNWRLGPAGLPLLKNKLVGMSVISRGFDYPGTKLRGAVGDALYLVNANGTPVNYTALYTLETE